MPDPAADDRERMVADQLAARGIRNPAVLGAMRLVPRHLFVPQRLRDQAYNDFPLQIGHGQTISQPYIVALMTALARPRPSDRALEIGTGCGYQSAVLAHLVAHVYSVEVNPALEAEAADRLAAMGYANVTVRLGDGYEGWASEAPFDIVLATAAPETVPQALLDQLAEGGRLVIPVGGLGSQHLRVFEKDEAGRTTSEVVAAVSFVPRVKGKESG